MGILKSFVENFYEQLDNNLKGTNMSLFNKINIIGNIVKDPFIGESKEWGVVRLACNTGKKEVEETLFIDVKLFSGAFRDLKNYDIKKGDKVSVSGTLKSDDYKDKEGVKRTGFSIYADYILKVSKREYSDEPVAVESTPDGDSSPF